MKTAKYLLLCMKLRGYIVPYQTWFTRPR